MRSTPSPHGCGTPRSSTQQRTPRGGSGPDVAGQVAVRPAAKEAVYEALQGSAAARGIGWREIEVIRAPDGRPDVSLSGVATRRARELGVRRVLLSLSHTHLAAIAVAVLERD